MRVQASAAAGTAVQVAEECRELGLVPVHVGPSGVQLELDWPELARALLHLRIAQRVLIELSRAEVRDGDDLYEAASALPWEDWLDRRSTFAITATGTLPGGGTGRREANSASTEARGPLRHHVFAAQRVKDAIADRLTERLGGRPDVDVDDPDVRVVVRFQGNRCTFSLDPAGAALFQRGWRQQQVEAPLKETLAAAVVAHAAWHPERPLRDAFCGSGTLIVEALHRGLGIAPGIGRFFAVERWPHHGAEVRLSLDPLRAEAIDAARAAASAAVGQLDVIASDVDPAALAVTARNLSTAGLDGVVQLMCVDAVRLAPPPPGTVLLGNPPYGERIGGRDVGDLYRALGDHWRKFDGAEAWLVDGHPQFRQQFGLRPFQTVPLRNGALEIRLQGYHLGHS